MNSKEYIAVASSEHFVYKAETNRPWRPETILELLEQAHQEFEKLMGPGLDTVIEVEDRMCESNNVGARAEIRKQIHFQQTSIIEVKFICEFPQNYGYTEQERELAYHFFVHELFHCWVGGNVSSSDGLIIEAITQYMTDLMIGRLGWCNADFLIQGRANWQEIVKTANLPHKLIAEYKLRFHKMYTNDPDRLFDFCRDLATCFRQQRSREKTDISPVLQQYLGTVLKEDQENNTEE